MPDGSNLSRDAQKALDLCAEDRANRLHAIVVALNELRPENSHVCLTADEAENVKFTLLDMALEESTALLATDGFR